MLAAPPGMQGQGWWPVGVAVPTYDPRAQAPGGSLVIGAPDAATRHVPATAGLRALTVAEIASLPAIVVTGNQWAFALADPGLSSLYEAAIAKSKPKDRIRIGLIARDTRLVASDPLLIRIAANAGSDDAGKALIDVATVHAHAQGMPL